jgi:hypothetical protein
MSGYTKLFASIVHSTIWQTPAPTRLCWVTMLALADRDGLIEASIPGLAKASGIALAECEAALACFLAPDPYSRTPDHEGRRIEVVKGGWRLLNHALYREMSSGEQAREKNRQRVARWRAKKAAEAEAAAGSSAASGNVTVPDVTLGNPIADPAPDPAPDPDPDLGPSAGKNPPPSGSGAAQGGRVSAAPAGSGPAPGARPAAPSSMPPSAPPRPPAAEPDMWSAMGWWTRWSEAWCAAYPGQEKNEPDKKSLSRLADQLLVTPEHARKAAQERVGAILDEYLSSADPVAVDTRHSFALFVERWKNLRMPKRGVKRAAGAVPATAPRRRSEPTPAAAALPRDPRTDMYHRLRSEKKTHDEAAALVEAAFPETPVASATG